MVPMYQLETMLTSALAVVAVGSVVIPTIGVLSWWLTRGEHAAVPAAAPAPTAEPRAAARDRMPAEMPAAVAG